MNTDTLIQILSREPIDDRAMSFKLRVLLSVGAGSMLSLLYDIFQLGIQADLLEKMTTIAFWIKLGFAISLFVLGLLITTKAAKPGQSKPTELLVIGAPIAVLWGIALFKMMQPSNASVTEMVEGSSWQVCSMRIAALSIPMFIAMFWSLRSMAPTRPRLAGFTAGLFAGGLSACIYALYCGEYSPVFIGIWYLLGIMTPAVAGALLGKTLLKW